MLSRKFHALLHFSTCLFTNLNGRWACRIPTLQRFIVLRRTDRKENKQPTQKRLFQNCSLLLLNRLFLNNVISLQINYWVGFFIFCRRLGWHPPASVLGSAPLLKPSSRAVSSIEMMLKKEAVLTVSSYQKVPASQAVKYFNISSHTSLFVLVCLAKLSIYVPVSTFFAWGDRSCKLEFPGNQ